MPGTHVLPSTSGDTQVWGVQHDRNDGDQSAEISVHIASLNGGTVPDSYRHTPTTTYTTEDESTPPPSLPSTSADFRNYNRHIHSISGSTSRLNSNAALSQDILQTLGLHYRHGTATNDRTTARGDLSDDSDSEVNSTVPTSYRATHNQTRRILQHQRAISVPYYRSMSSSQDPGLTNGVSQNSYEGVGRLRSMSLPSRKAILQLDFLIVGGGIAGFACAYALGQSGHRVRVLEKAGGLGQRSGGIRVPPNLTKILLEWGLADELAKATQRCRGSTFHSLETGDTIGYLEWKDDVIQETGAEFLLMHHDDLHTMLYELAISAGATIDFDTTITSVSVDEETDTPHVLLANGTVLKADVVVGADGYRSVVREAVTGRDDHGIDSGMSVYTATISAELMKTDPELSHLPDLPEWPMWMGDARSVLGYPVRQGKEYCVHVFWPDNELQFHGIDETEEGWDVVVPTDVLNMKEGDDRSVADAELSRINRLIKLIPDALRTKFVRREQSEDWVDESGRLVLIGEAAHPIMPCGIHSSSLAVEDAAVLGVLMSRVRTWDQIPTLLEAFQDLRQKRCNDVYHSELNNAALLWLPPGPDRDARDAGMRQSMSAGCDHWDEGQLREQWEDISEVFGYNAREAAEDWWVNWGVLRESSKAVAVHEPLDLQITQVVATATMSNAWLPDSSVMV